MIFTFFVGFMTGYVIEACLEEKSQPQPQQPTTKD